MGEPILLSISQMIDQAIGTPEIGVVNFNMLQAVLHCIVQQINIQDKHVELRGPTAYLPAQPGVPVATVAVHEFAVDPKAGTMREVRPAAPDPKHETVLVAEKVTGESLAPGQTPKGGGGYQTVAPGQAQGGGGQGKGGGGGYQADAPGQAQGGGGAAPGQAQGGGGATPGQAQGGGGGPGGIPVESLRIAATKVMTTPSGEALSIVTLSKFNVLADAVDDIRRKVYSTLPKNEAILENVRTASNEKAITDMWSTLNVQGRLDAAENGIAKLSSLVEDLINETPELKQQHASKVLRAKNIATDVMTPRGGPQGQPGAPGGYAPPGTPGMPGAPGVQPGAPEKPGAPGVAYAPGQPGAPPMPGAPGVAYAPGQPGAPPVPGAPGVAYAPGQPGAPPMPGAPEVAYAPGQPGAPPMPGAPGVAYAPGQPGAPGMPAGAPGGGYGPPGAPGGGYGPTGAPGGGYGPPGAQGAGGYGPPPGSPGAPGEFGSTWAAAPEGGYNYAPGMFGAPGPYEAPAAMTKFATYATQDPGGGFANMDSGDLQAIAKNVKDLRSDLDNLYETFYNTMEASGIEPADTSKPPSTALAHSMAQALQNIERDPMLEAAKRGGFRRNPLGFDPSDLYTRLFELDRKMTWCCDNIDRNTTRWQDKLDRLEDQVDYVLKQMGINTNDIQNNRLKPDMAQDLQSLMELFQTVQGIQEQLKQVHDTAMMLAAEKEQRQHHINSLLEQIELLKIIKMDREDMAEAMAEKADVRMLARKVSHDQFEMACDDLAKGLEHAIGKLNLQEALWQQALDDIQREIETKLDKMELSPVKEFFNNKLKMLQDNLKQLAQLRREVEAAGTKRRLLRDVNCISCDANAVMAMENGPCLPGNKPITAMHSMKPYLTYELDSIRKTQASHLPQRNMHDWETIDRKMGHQKPLQRVRSETDKHICNRYCGGSHTVTTPAQRVARVGHFVKQWGPDVLPLSTGLAAGDDGKMYKVTNVAAANMGPSGLAEICTPRPQKKPSDTRLPRSIVIANIVLQKIQMLEMTQTEKMEKTAAAAVECRDRECNEFHRTRQGPGISFNVIRNPSIATKA